MVLFRFLIVTTVLAWTSGCGKTAPEADPNPAPATSKTMSAEDQAANTVKAMLALAQKGEWGAYVDDYYGESQKFGSDADRNKLVERFEQKWGAKVVDALKQAATVAPVIDDEGKAVFNVDGQPAFVLYKTEDGKWKFHL